ncbi:MAG: hypothetical protein ABI668_12855 [Sphingorhabdus sp.]
MSDRQTVIANHKQRMQARDSLTTDVKEAKVELNPRTQIDRWVVHRKEQAREVAGQVSLIARKSAPFIGAVGVAALLFFARQPISNWIKRLKSAKSQPTTDD